MPQKPLILPNGAGAPPRQKQPDVSHAKTVCCEYCGHNIFTLGFVLKEINGLELGIGPGMTTVPLEVPNLFICANCGKPHYLNDNIKRHIEALLAGDGSLAKIEEEDRKQMEEIQRAQAEKEAKEAEKEALAAQKAAEKEAAAKKRKVTSVISSTAGSAGGTVGREVGNALGNAIGGKFGKKIGGNIGATLGRGILKTLFSWKN